MSENQATDDGVKLDEIEAEYSAAITDLFRLWGPVLDEMADKHEVRSIVAALGKLCMWHLAEITIRKGRNIDLSFSAFGEFLRTAYETEVEAMMRKKSAEDSMK